MLCWKSSTKISGSGSSSKRLSRAHEANGMEHGDAARHQYLLSGFQLFQADYNNMIIVNN